MQLDSYQYTSTILVINDQSALTLQTLAKHTKTSSVNFKLLNLCVNLYSLHKSSRFIEKKDLIDNGHSNSSIDRFIKYMVDKMCASEELAIRSNVEVAVKNAKIRLITIKNLSDVVFDTEKQPPKKIRGHASVVHQARELARNNAVEVDVPSSPYGLLSPFERSLNGVIAPGKSHTTLKKRVKLVDGVEYTDVSQSSFGVMNDYDSLVSGALLAITQEYLQSRNIDENITSDIRVPIRLSQVTNRLGKTHSNDRIEISKSIVKAVKTDFIIRSPDEIINPEGFHIDNSGSMFRLIVDFFYVTNTIDDDKENSLKDKLSDIVDRDEKEANKLIDEVMGNDLPFSAFVVVWSPRIMHYLKKRPYLPSVNQLIHKLEPTISNLYSMLLEDYSKPTRLFTAEKHENKASIFELSEHIWPYESVDVQKQMTNNLLNDIKRLTKKNKKGTSNMCKINSFDGDKAIISLFLLGFELTIDIPHYSKRRVANLYSTVTINVNRESLFESAGVQNMNKALPVVPNPIYEHYKPKALYLPKRSKKLEEQFILLKKNKYVITFSHQYLDLTFSISAYSDYNELLELSEMISQQCSVSSNDAQILLEHHRTKLVVFRPSISANELDYFSNLINMSRTDLIILLSGTGMYRYIDMMENKRYEELKVKIASKIQKVKD